MPVQSMTLLDEFDIPAQPEILHKITATCQQQAPDLALLTDIITQDLYLSGTILQTINSPLYGLADKVNSIQHAVALLGTKKILILARSAALRLNFKLPLQFKAILDDAHDIALVCSAIAHRLGCVEVDIAYSLGLFHMSGIPVLMQHFPDYAEFYQAARLQRRPLTCLEQERYGINYSKVSGAFCRKWLLSSPVIIAVENHYRPFAELYAKFPYEQHKLSMIALLRMGIYINHVINKFYRQNDSIESEWQANQTAILAFLGLSELDYLTLVDFITAHSSDLQ